MLAVGRNRELRAKQPAAGDMESLLERNATKAADNAAEKICEKAADLAAQKIDAKCLPMFRQLEEKLDSAVAMSKKMDIQMQKSASMRSSSCPTGTFVPNYVEIKGFVDRFEDAKTSGVTHEQASELVRQVKGSLPEPLQANISDFELRGQKSFFHQGVHPG